MGIGKASVHNKLYLYSSKTGKEVLDEKNFEETALMDLFNSFDAIKHDPLIAKLYRYGFNKESLKLFNSCLNIRWPMEKQTIQFMERLGSRCWSSRICS